MTEHSAVSASSGAATALGRMTVSIGCAALIAEPDVDNKQFIEPSDQALYAAKRSCRNRVCCVTHGSA